VKNNGSGTILVMCIRDVVSVEAYGHELENSMRLYLLLIAFGMLVTIPACFPGGVSRSNTRVVHYNETGTPTQQLWSVRLRNAHTRVHRTFDVYAPSRERAIDQAMARARREGWGNAPVALVWANHKAR